MPLINLIKFQVMGDERGSLVSLEENSNIPFKIKRVYYIYGTNVDVSRGFHAHKNLEQVVVCLNGSCRFVLDNGRTREEVVLDSPDIGLHINGLIWREMHDFTEDCVLMVLASERYLKDDYILEYNDFLLEAIAKWS